jgi:hypothetical protein
MSKLNTAERKALPTKVFGLPEERGYPLEDAGHARAALSRAKANATPEQQKKIKAKIHRMYPGMRVAGDPSKMSSLSSMAA